MQGPNLRSTFCTPGVSWGRRGGCGPGKGASAPARRWASRLAAGTGDAGWWGGDGDGGGDGTWAGAEGGVHGNERGDGHAGGLPDAGNSGDDDVGENLGELPVMALVRQHGRQDAANESQNRTVAAGARWGLGRRRRGALDSCRILVQFQPDSCSLGASDWDGRASKPLRGHWPGPDTDSVVWLFQRFHCLETWGRDPCSPGPAPRGPRLLSPERPRGNS